MTFKALWGKRWLLRALVPSIIFNFRFLPLKQALKLPIILYKAKIISSSGKIILNGKIKFGMVRLGEYRVSIFPNSGIILENRGTIIFNGRAFVGNASAISVGNNGVLYFGKNAGATCAAKIACYNSIKIENDVLIGWGCQLFDTDFHRIKYQEDECLDTSAQAFGSIVISEGTWIANGCKIYKNTYIPKKCIVGADTILRNFHIDQPYSLVINKRNISSPVQGIYLDRQDDSIIYPPHTHSTLITNTLRAITTPVYEAA